MTARRFRAAGLAVCALAFVSLGGGRASHAQSGADKSAAEALFDEALRKLDAKDYASACKSLEASQRLDPGIGTLLYLADCYEKQTRIATAWATFREAASTATAAGQSDRAAVATRRAAALEGRLPRLAINVPPASDVAGLEIHRDGAVLPRFVWGEAMPVDPGAHSVEAVAPGRLPWSTKVTSETGTAPSLVDVPVLDLAPVAPPPLVANQDKTTPPSNPRTTHGGWTSQTTAGVVLGIVGLAGIGVGAGFGVRAGSSNQQADSNCRPTDPTQCNATGVADGKQAQTSATVSTVALIAGGAVLVTGVVVLFTGSSTPKTSSSTWFLKGGPGVVATAPGLLVGRTW